MESKHKRTQRDYSLAFKLSVVEQVEQGELTYKEAQRRYGIQGRSTVLVWLRKHGLQDWDVPASRAGDAATMPDKTSKPQTPEQRIKALEAQLREATQKAQLFEAIIEQVKKNTGVDPLKKPLGRSSHKRSSRVERVQGLPLHRHQPSGVLPAAGGAAAQRRTRRPDSASRARRPLTPAPDRDTQAAPPVGLPTQGGGYQDGA